MCVSSYLRVDLDRRNVSLPVYVLDYGVERVPIVKLNAQLGRPR